MNKIRVWLSHPYLPIIAVLLAVVLTLPSLWNGLNLDDNVHRLILQGDKRFSPRSSSPLNLFCFVDGDPEENRRLKEIGMNPWWINDEFKLSFFRPLSALTHWFDYLLWPNTPALMHIQSLIWFGILVLLIAFLYKRIMVATWVAGLAALLFAIDDAHGGLVGWLASRNALIAGVFGVLCLMAHDRWRLGGWRRGILLGPVCFALSLLSAEAGIAIGAYLLAHALFLERTSFRTRIICLIPYGFVLILWGLLYFLLDCGAKAIPAYIDPIKDPLTYLLALFFHTPAYILGQWALPPAFCYFPWPSFMHKAGLIFTVFLALILSPLIRKDQTARFWAAGMILSLLPICAKVPEDRILLFVGLGAMGLLAQWFSWMDQAKWNLKSRLWRISSRIILIFFILVHVVLAPLSLPITTRAFALLEESIEQASESLPSGPEFEDKRFVLVNTPLSLYFVVMLCWHRAVNVQRFTPLRTLTAGNNSLILRRIDSHTIEIRAENGSLTDSDLVFPRSKKFRMSPGQIVELSNMIVEVLEVNDELPSAASFRFAVPLEDSSLVWFQWQDGKYVPFTPPAIGETINIEGAHFGMV